MGLFQFLRGADQQPTIRVRMIASVDAAHVAGEQYDLPVDLADRYIARGYAEGVLSRAYSEDELVALKGNDSQIVGI